MFAILRALGLILIILGLLSLAPSPWLGAIDIGLGSAAVFGSVQLRGRSSAGVVAFFAALGVSTLLAWYLGLVFDAPAWLTWWTFALGMMTIAAAMSMVNAKRPNKAVY